MREFVGRKALSGETIWRDIIYMFVFGLFSSALGLVSINIPGIAGGASNLREIPLLIGIIHFSSPLPIIGACFLSALSTPEGGSVLGSFIMHSIAVTILWIIFRYLRRYKLATLTGALVWFFNVLVYYVVLLLPFYILSNYILGINSGRHYLQFYSEMVSSTQLEMLASAIVSSLYLIQYDMRIALQKHKENLEITVSERTEELVSTIEELKAAQQHLIQSSKMASLGTLTAGVAHEINNPLNFISGGVYILEDIRNEENPLTTEEKLKELDTARELVREGLERTRTVVKALAAFSQAGASAPVSCNIHQVIDNVLNFLNFRTGDIEIIKDYRLQNNLFLYPDKMHQVFMHLFDNAIYALNTDAVKPRKIFVSTDTAGSNAVIKVANTGPAIPEKHLNQIFDPFFTTKDPGKGPGIGLSLCYTIISEQKGEIYALNETDRVVFIIELPLER